MNNRIQKINNSEKCQNSFVLKKRKHTRCINKSELSPFIVLLVFDTNELKCVSAHSLLFLSRSYHCFRGNTLNYFSDQYTLMHLVHRTHNLLLCLNKKCTSNTKKYRYLGYNYLGIIGHYSFSLILFISVLFIFSRQRGATSNYKWIKLISLRTS